MVQVDQRRLRDGWAAHPHPSADGGIQNPRRGHDDHARRGLEVDDWSRSTLLAPLAAHTTPVQGVPAIVNLDLPPDMGRMAG